MEWTIQPSSHYATKNFKKIENRKTLFKFVYAKILQRIFLLDENSDPNEWPVESAGSIQAEHDVFIN